MDEPLQSVGNDELVSNGIDGTTGKPLLPNLSIGQISKIALGIPFDEDRRQSLMARLGREEDRLVVAEHVDPTDIASAGWGVIFPCDVDPRIPEALKKLLDYRKDQAGRFFRNCSGSKTGHCPGDSKKKFLNRNGAKSNVAADPEFLPYYLMIVASPEKIPYEFQYDLDIEYAVGRLWFDTPEGLPDLDAFASYAAGVVDAEKGAPRPRRTVFFGTRHPDEKATELSSAHLIDPLIKQLSQPGWQSTPVVGANATKCRLKGLLGGDETPPLLFTASHGIGLPRTNPRQLADQGALLCQDWSGGQLNHESYFSAEDVVSNVAGLIAFHFACYSAGTPDHDDFSHVPGLKDYSTPRPIVARLPQRLLSKGALAVVGHIDRAWPSSFRAGNLPGDFVTTYRSTLERIMKGKPIGWAMEYFNLFHASLGKALGDEMNSVLTICNYKPDPYEIAKLWTANSDARNFVVLGDPAVRLKLEAPPPAI